MKQALLTRFKLENDCEENEVMKEVKTGIISETQLVDLFSTEKQKEKYLSLGKFSGVNKQTILKQAARQCEIMDIGKRQYEITKVYKYPVPKNFDKMNSGMHRYMTPLILINLIGAKIHEVENVTFTCMKWHRMIEMINENYVTMKHNISYSSDKLSLSKNVLYDFFSTTDDTLVYYFKKSLEYLKEANLFNYQELNWICVRHIRDSVDENGKKILQITHEHRRASYNEMKFIRKCDQRACIEVGISKENDCEKYYGEKSKAYQAKLKELLMKENIVTCYKAYEIYSTDNDIMRCHQLLSNFKMDDIQAAVENMNKDFQKSLVVNAEKRIANRPEKRNLFSNADIANFMKDYEKVIELTLSSDANKVRAPRLNGTTLESEINKIINDNLCISYNGSVVSIGVDSNE